MYASGSTTRRRTRSRRDDDDDDDSDDDNDDDKDTDDECIMMHPYIATWPPLGSSRARGPELDFKTRGKERDARG